jgi:TPR repeat protein
MAGDLSDRAAVVASAAVQRTARRAAIKILLQGIRLAAGAWVLYSLMGWFTPGALCWVGLSDYCAEASMRALERKPSDGAAAFRYADRGCKLGSRMACNDLGVSYQRGEGTAKNARLAAQHYTEACNAGLGLGCYNVGQLFADDPERTAQAAAAFAHACTLKYAPGCAQATQRHRDRAQMLSFAAQGCALDDNFSCAIQAALLGNTGQASAEARNIALKMTDKCAENDAVSCTTLGLLYGLGAGVAQDDARCRELLRRGCNLGNRGACQLSKEPERLSAVFESVKNVVQAPAAGASEIGL